MSGPSFFAPEVIQTSTMDCGPAALKSLLEGFGISASYGRLREACQTDVDGTSIDTLEEIAVRLGLDAEQIMVPLDHVLLDESEALPALVLVRLPNGFSHFVVVWRRVGRFVQVMDPATGRRWVTAARLLGEVHAHAMRVPAAAFEEWVGAGGFEACFRVRARAIGCDGDELLAGATAWRDRAALDAALRWTESVVAAGGVSGGAEASAVLSTMLERAREEGAQAIEPSFWTGTPAPPGDDGVEQVLLRGAVLLHVRGRRAPTGDAAAPLSEELARVLDEPKLRPWQTLAGFLGGDGGSGAALRRAIGVALIAAAAGAVLEALLLRAVLGMGQQLGVVQQRLGAMTALLVLLLVLLAVEASSAWGVSRLGRRLETRLRVAFLEKIPRLTDRYFASRPISDMAERCHAGQRVRVLPDVAHQALRTCAEIVVTVAGIAWLDPPSLPWAAMAATASVLTPVAFMSTLTERDMKMRTHDGALARFYLDALLGLSPIRTHGAERSVSREHEALLVEWSRAVREMITAYVTSDLAQALVGTLLAIGLLFRYVRGAGDSNGVILLMYWALSLPSLGQSLGRLLRQLPGHRNTALRLLEPLGALEDPIGGNGVLPLGAVDLAFEGVSVIASGHTILKDVDLRIRPGEHVAIVGASGAGKSSLIGLLLGWHRAASGHVLVNGEPLESMRAPLRAATAWVDPAVQIWNRSVVNNLLYGASRDAPTILGRAIAASELASVLEKLPDGMQTSLGEGGGMVSGGEGQRVRLARGLLRNDARLVLLDEPFRGLDRERRKELLAATRAWWSEATMLCATHDVIETTSFDRVLVIDGGQVVEDGPPSGLLGTESRYRAMVEAEKKVLRDVWGDPSWRRFRVVDGHVVETERPGTDAADDDRVEERSA